MAFLYCSSHIYREHAPQFELFSPGTPRWLSFCPRFFEGLLRLMCWQFLLFLQYLSNCQQCRFRFPSTSTNHGERMTCCCNEIVGKGHGSGEITQMTKERERHSCVTHQYKAKLEAQSAMLSGSTTALYADKEGCGTSPVSSDHIRYGPAISLACLIQQLPVWLVGTAVHWPWRQFRSRRARTRAALRGPVHASPGWPWGWQGSGGSGRAREAA